MGKDGWQDVLAGKHAVTDHARRALAKRYAAVTTSRPELGRLAGPADTRSLAVHRWAAYKEGYAPGLVDAVLDALPEPPKRVLDVFAGVGTTLLAARARDIESVGVELLPYAHFVAQTKLGAHEADPGAVLELGRAVLRSRRTPAYPASVPAAEWALTGQARDTLGTLYAAIEDRTPGIERDLVKLALLSIVEEVSQATKDGTSVRRIPPGRRRGRWGTVLGRGEVRALFRARIAAIVDDLRDLPSPRVNAMVVCGDARALPDEVVARQADAAVFSPPYPNRYDYSAIYQLELAYGFVSCNTELKQLRKQLLRSHLEAPGPEDRTVEQPALDEFLHALLARKSVGDQTGRTFRMIAGYFEDMRQVLKELTLVLPSGGTVSVVVGTQTFHGQHLPTDLLLASIAETLGMTTEAVWVLRAKGMAVQQRKEWGEGSTRESVVRLVV